LINDRAMFGGKMNKYHNIKTEIDGITFSSKRESNYYLELKIRQRAGDIEGFNLQPRYLLQEAFTKNGKRYRAIFYVADFEIYHNDGSIEVVDCKGKATQVYGIKKKLFEKRYPDLTIREV
jgi:hypothetical protein